MRALHCICTTAQLVHPPHTTTRPDRHSTRRGHEPRGVLYTDSRHGAPRPAPSRSPPCALGAGARGGGNRASNHRHGMAMGGASAQGTLWKRMLPPGRDHELRCARHGNAAVREARRPPPARRLAWPCSSASALTTAHRALQKCSRPPPPASTSPSIRAHSNPRHQHERGSPCAEAHDCARASPLLSTRSASCRRRPRRH